MPATLQLDTLSVRLLAWAPAGLLALFLLNDFLGFVGIWNQEGASLGFYLPQATWWTYGVLVAASCITAFVWCLERQSAPRPPAADATEKLASEWRARVNKALKQKRRSDRQLVKSLRPQVTQTAAGLTDRSVVGDRRQGTQRTDEPREQPNESAMADAGSDHRNSDGPSSGGLPSSSGEGAPALELTTEPPPVELPPGMEQLVLREGETRGGTHCFSKLSARKFNVRGRTYMSDSVKVHAGESLLPLVHVELFRHAEPLRHVAAVEGGFLDRARRAGDRRDYLIINYQTPAQNAHLILYYAVPPEFPPHSEREIRTVWDRFYNDPSPESEYRNARWKVIPSIAEGNWVVQSSVGSKPALLATKLTHTWIKGDGYLEVDCDVCSSTTASLLVQLMHSYAQYIVIDLGFTVEGRSQEELPEHIFGSIRLSRLNLGGVPEIPVGSYGEDDVRVLPPEEESAPRQPEGAAPEDAGSRWW